MHSVRSRNLINVSHSPCSIALIAEGLGGLPKLRLELTSWNESYKDGVHTCLEDEDHHEVHWREWVSSDKEIAAGQR